MARSPRTRVFVPRLRRARWSSRAGAAKSICSTCSSSATRRAAQGGPRVLMATAIGSYAHAVTLESALAVALTFRGAEVHALLCDGTMTACAECEASIYPDLEGFVEHGPSRDLCRDCSWPAENVYKTLGLKIHRMSDWLSPAERAEARRIASTLPPGEIEAF